MSTRIGIENIPLPPIFAECNHLPGKFIQIKFVCIVIQISLFNREGFILINSTTLLGKGRAKDNRLIRNIYIVKK